MDIVIALINVALRLSTTYICIYYSYFVLVFFRFYDIDEAIKNYRSRKNEDSKESTSSIFSKPFSEPDNKSCIYIPIFLIEIYCFEKNNLLYFIFILFIFFMTSAFIFLLIKFYKNWKYYRNYDIFKEYDETVSLFDDDI